MKLLLDENLSRRIVPFLQAAFPGSTQVVLLGLESSSDLVIWEYAKKNGFVVVSRDADFQERSLVSGHPPQVIWLKIPNRSKSFVLNILLDHQVEIEQALLEQNHACVEISPIRKAYY
jgi:predicted nuclease of predicted toxin-antitoxin system